MSHDLWIVQGSSGEYSDRTEWPVCWFATEEEAVRYARLLEGADESLGADRDDWRKRDEVKARMARAGDPNWRSDYTGTRYSVYSVPAGPEQA